MRAKQIHQLPHGHHSAGGVEGLELYVSKDGRTRTWSVRYRLGKKRPREKLGRFPRMTLSQAREAARIFLGTLPSGSVEKCACTGVQSVLGAYLDHTRRTKALRTYQRYETTVRLYLEPHFGDKAVSEVDVHHLLGIKRELRDRPGAWNLALAVWRASYRWGQRNGLCPSGPVPGELLEQNHLRPRENYLTLEECGVFVRALDLENPTHNTILLALLTGQRPGECSRAQMSDVDGDLWVVRGDQHKNRKPKVVPLSEWALEAIHRHVPRKATLYYPMRVLRRETGLTCRPMDLRRTVATQLLASGELPHVVWAVLGHKLVYRVGDAHYNQYAYLEERKAALKRWCETLRTARSASEPPPAQA